MFSAYKTKLKSKIKLTDNIYQFGFALVEPKILQFISGQYMLLCINDKYSQYSITTPENTTDYFEIVVEIFVNGLASDYLITRQINDQVIFKGPAGVFHLKNNDQVINRIFLATGTGIAPIKSMILSTISQTNIKYQLFWGLRYIK